MNYIDEFRAEDPQETGIEDNSVYLLVNSAGYFSVKCPLKIRHYDIVYHNRFSFGSAPGFSGIGLHL
jgi:hypothetical protein